MQEKHPESRRKVKAKYSAGMQAYTSSRQRVVIDSIGDGGYRCRYTYLTGEQKEKQGYIAEVGWLYTKKEKET